MAPLRLEELSAATALAANSLTLRAGQDQYVTPPTYAIADSYTDPLASWPRVVLDGSEVVGFIRGNFAPDDAQEEFRSAVWRVTVAGEMQGRGIGTFAVRALAEEARSRGFTQVTALWEPGEAGPDQFFRTIVVVFDVLAGNVGQYFLIMVLGLFQHQAFFQHALAFAERLAAQIKAHFKRHIEPGQVFALHGFAP